MRKSLIGALLCLPLTAATVKDCADLKHHGKLPEANSCYASLLNSQDAFTRAEALWALERYQDAADQFNLAASQNPKNAQIRVRRGRLFLERFDKEEAAKLFKEALAIDDNYAPAYLGLALVESDGFSIKAVENAQKAIKLDPKLVEAQEASRLPCPRRQRQRQSGQGSRQGARDFP